MNETLKGTCLLPVTYLLHIALEIKLSFVKAGIDYSKYKAL